MAKITPAQAIKRLIPKKKQGQAAPSRIVLTYDKTIGDKGLLYVINNETTGKSYLCPADDKLSPTIGEWDTAIVDASEEHDEVNSAFDDLIKMYESEIEQFQSGGDVDSDNGDTSTSGYADDPSSVGPLLKTKWAQRWPFNGKIPTFKYKSYTMHHLTGCAATAVSQLFYYWWQKGYYRGYPAISTYKASEGFDTTEHTINMPATTRFEYEKMETSYTLVEDGRDEQKQHLTESEEAVANLMLCMHVAFKSFYEDKLESDGFSRSTQVYANKVSSAFSNLFFVYDYFAKDRTISEHENNIVSNLDKGIPSLILCDLGDGSYDKNIRNKSHFFIADGYKRDSLGNYTFHFNFGLGGSKDGYFPLSAIDPHEYNITIAHLYHWSPEPSFKLGDVNINPDGTVGDGIVNEESFCILLNDIEKLKKNKNAQIANMNRKNLDYDSSNIVTDSDIEILAKHTLKYNKDASSSNTILIASLIDIRRSFRDITSIIESKIDTSIIPNANYKQFMGETGESPVTRNEGAFVIRKAPENISTNDIINAYTLPDFSEDWPTIDVGDEYPNTEFIVTGERLGLIPGLYEYNIDDTGKRLAIGDTYSVYNPSTDTTTKITPNIKSYLTQDQVTAINNWKTATGQSVSNSIYLKDVGLYNQYLLRNVIEDDNLLCSGLKLNAVYALYYDTDNAYGSVALSRARQSFINLPRDFIVDGNVDGKAIGGFFVRWGVFYTEYSLYLRKVNIMKNDKQCISFAINSYGQPNGIDQIRIEDCFFHGISSTSIDPKGDSDEGSFDKREGYSYGGNFVSLFFDESMFPRVHSVDTPLSEFASSNYTGELLSTNVIHHLLIIGNNVYGSSFIDSNESRFSDTYRVLNNNFYFGDYEDNKKAGYRVSSGDKSGRGGVAISHSISNDSTYYYGPYTTYYSCPKWYSGNNFYGADRIHALRLIESSYYGGILLEGGIAYVLNNTFKNYVDKVSIFNKTLTDANGNTVHRGGLATYDIYASCVQLYFAKNTIINVFSITNNSGSSSGLFKAKGSNIPYRYRPGWKYYQCVRYYSDNNFTIDEEWIERKWNLAVGNNTTDGELYMYMKSSQRDDIRWDDKVDASGKILASDTKDEEFMYGEKTVNKKMGENLYDYINNKIMQFYGSGVRAGRYITTAVNQYVIKNNTFDMGNGSFGGSAYNGDLRCVHFTMINNTFKAKRMPGTRWSQINVDPAKANYVNYKDALITVQPWDFYRAEYQDTGTAAVKIADGEPCSITVTGNKIYVGDYVSNNTILPTQVRLLIVRVNYSVYEEPYLYGATQSQGFPYRNNVVLSNNTINDTSDGQPNSISQIFMSGTKSLGGILTYYTNHSELP